MATVLCRLARSQAFDENALFIMGDAYDRAMHSFIALPNREMREAIAGQIFALAERGLLDSIKLCQEALAAYRLESQCDPIAH